MTVRRIAFRLNLFYLVFITIFIVNTIGSDDKTLATKKNLPQNILRLKNDNIIGRNISANSNHNVNDINIQQERLLDTAVHYPLVLHRQHKSRFSKRKNATSKEDNSPWSPDSNKEIEPIQMQNKVKRWSQNIRIDESDGIGIDKTIQLPLSSDVEYIEEKPPLGICQPYTGTTCEAFLKNQSVFIPPGTTLETLEDNLKGAYYGVIKESKDMNPNCRGYALPSLCYSVLPICRTPDETNHLFFRNLAIAREYEQSQKLKMRSTTAPLTSTSMPSSTEASSTESSTEPSTTTKQTIAIETTDEGTTTSTTTTSTTQATLTSKVTRRPHKKKNNNESRTRQNKPDVMTNRVTTSPDIYNQPIEGTDFNGRIIEGSEQLRIKRSFDNKKMTSISTKSASMISLETIKKSYTPTRNTENLRRICRNECELLETELCQKEYAIAKRHPVIGQILPLEDCFNLPEAAGDCSTLGIAIDVDENEHCYWENGSKYRGTVAVSQSGKPCLTWARMMKEIADYPELAGQNYCRNPGGSHESPWCYVLINQSIEKVIEPCSIPKCSDKMWLYIIGGFVTFALIIMITIIALCCRKYRKNVNGSGMANIQNINLPNAGKNIYGNSRLNSPIEMTSLLATNNHQGNASVVNNTNSNKSPQHQQAHRRSQQQLAIQQQYQSRKNKSFSGNSCMGGNIGLNANEMSSGAGSSSGEGSTRGESSGGRNAIHRVAQYTLNDVKFVEELGEGAFGKVYKGELTQATGERIFVAVKALKENASAKTQADFKREIELISDLRHDNIVCILGVVLKEEPLCMLFEYMTQGDLHEFLIANSPNESSKVTSTSTSSSTGPLSQLQFLYIAMQICDGMEYLAGHHYVHRDLAARNCLVGDALTVKISDFGLSRDIYSSDYYRVQSKSLLPVRWMPSESILYGKFTTESDVWSFGVVLWEIYSYGLQPYYGYSNQEVISMVRARQLLPCPEACPSPVYSLMVECWHEQAVRRPSFAEIGHRLKIWYQAQKRSEQAENLSNSSSRKGSAFNVSAIARANSITPSSSSHHLTSSNVNGVNPRSKDYNGELSNHSLERDRSSQHSFTSISSSSRHHHSHSHNQQHPQQHSHQRHQKSHHSSLDRDNNGKTANESNSRQFYNTNPMPHSHIHKQHSNPSRSVTKSRSSQSNTSISMLDGYPDINNSEEFLNFSASAMSNHRCSGSINGDSIETRSCGGGRSKPPTDPSKYHQHHHHHHHHCASNNCGNGPNLIRKKSVGDVGELNSQIMHKKAGASGSVSSISGDAANAYKVKNKCPSTKDSECNRTINSGNFNPNISGKMSTMSSSPAAAIIK